ncbi:MAG: hypothetical protein JSR36_12655 [Proteobacteria bacterium]|nr:hypothetical protein [Pseudomonadota bacterium]
MKADHPQSGCGTLIGSGIAVLVCSAALLTSSCADTYAAEGAKSGAVGGAVAGAVLGIFTGNVGGSMLAGAAASAAAGAAIGGMTPKAPPGTAPAPAPAQGQAGGGTKDPKLLERQHELENKIGAANFDAARMLALCRHSSAIELARNAYKTADTQERRGYALMIEAVTAEEKGDSATAAAVYPRLVEVDPQIGSADKARNAALSGVLKVQQVRKDYGLPPTCT